eukprot:TRINITY_DN255_c0_g1_i2.p1 TRINITY_DN255_c0_g1~~TRINITY_DN255_c0_g1_i2.p1  ORF type:complete len:913 (-),score=207.25 TRINITY_DN255_c0_g1_i2:39-2777(-)
MSMFKKSLTDLIRGLRSASESESAYISGAMKEIKDEIKSKDFDVKSMAIKKLIYLHMLGYDMSWADFNIVEVMSQSKFTNKRIAYLAANQSFTQETDVITLTTNAIRKDILGTNTRGKGAIYEAGNAINCLANICTLELSRDLAGTVVSLLTSTRPYIRKRAILCLFPIYEKYPPALPPSFSKLREKLSDPDPSVASAAVNVVLELARTNPKNYLTLAPTLFNILTNSTNNWMLIKVVKIFGLIAPLEPRLAARLVDPLCGFINTHNNAMSLLYECIKTCIACLPNNRSVIRLCLTKLRTFIDHPDCNLKYLGLLAMAEVMKVQPKGVAEHRDLILNCLDDEDISIRLRALELLSGMVSKHNLAFIIGKLKDHIAIADSSYQAILIEKIVKLCSLEKYSYISDFGWYINTLIDLTKIPGAKNGCLVRHQLLEISIRVKSIRPFSVNQMMYLIADPNLRSENIQEDGMCEALYAAAWIVGEYSNLLEGMELKALESLLNEDVVSLPSHIQATYLQNVLKLFIHLAENDRADEAITVIEENLSNFTSSIHLEVQERACFLVVILEIYKEEIDNPDTNLLAELKEIVSEEIKAVSPNAPKKVRLPEGLDIDSWINEPMPEDDPDMYNENGFEWEPQEYPTNGDYPDNQNLSPMEIHERNRKIEEIKKARSLGNDYILGNGGGFNSEDIPTIPLEQIMETNFDSPPNMNRNPNNPRNQRGMPRRMINRPTAELEIDLSDEMPDGWEDMNSSGEESEEDVVKNSLANVDLSNADADALSTSAYPIPLRTTTQQTRSNRGGQRGNRGGQRGNRGGQRGNRGQPRGNRGAPRGNRGQLRGNLGQPRGNRGAPRGNRGQLRGNLGQPRGNRGAPRGNRGARGNRGQPRGNRGQPRGHRGAPRGNRGQPRGQPRGNRGRGN